MTKVLVSTTETQGKRKNDFCHIDGEKPVTFSTECDGERIDGKCGCRRSMSGLTGGATTTFKVVELKDFDLHFELKNHFLAGNWDKYLSPDELEEMIENEEASLNKIANHFETGTILEKRGNSFQSRPNASIEI